MSCVCVCVRLLAQIIQAHLRMGKIIRTKKGLGNYLSVMIKSEGCVFLYLSWKEIIKNGKNWPPAFFGPNLENQSQNFSTRKCNYKEPQQMLQSLLQNSACSPGRGKIHIRRNWDERWRESKCMSHKMGPCRLLCIYKAVDKNHGNFDLSSFWNLLFVYWI